MKSLALALACLIVASTSAPVAADGNKSVQNMKGSVSYQKPNKPAKPIANQASIVLADQDVTVTGLDSEAAVTLPDSSRVLVGADAKVQLAFFNQTAIANAKFVIYQGRFRFSVEHPSGAKANYTFQTPTGNVAVRGTQGDIGVADDGTLSVNVYELSNPDLPVEVTTKDGKTFTLNAGQGFVGQIINGIIQGQISTLTNNAVNQFSPEFGVPTSWAALHQQLCDQATARAQAAADQAMSSVPSFIPRPRVPSPAECK
jgi:hypothetical protein